MSDLLDRIRSAAGSAEPSWTPERAVANEAAIRRRTVRRRQLRRTMTLAVALGCLAVAALARTRLATSPAPRVTLYADGSTATPLVTDAEIKVTSSGAASITSEIARGSYLFTVVKNAGRAFRVDAGEVQIEVVGTEFQVDRRADGRVRVEVRRGRVRVGWADQKTELTDGEVGLFPRPSMAPNDAPRSPDVRAPAVVTPSSALPHGSPSWQRLARAGDYDGAYLALQHGQVDAREPADLMLAADAARLSHHPASALPPLRTVLAKHGADPRAPLAAFTLGRILLDDLGQPREAAAAFAQARVLAPGGPLVEDALAREVEAWSRGGDVERARERADAYLASYPAGVHVRSVRRFGGVE